MKNYYIILDILNSSVDFLLADYLLCDLTVNCHGELWNTTKSQVAFTEFFAENCTEASDHHQLCLCLITIAIN